MKSCLLVLLFQLFILFACCQPLQKLDDYNVANVSNDEVQQHRYRRTLKHRPPLCNVNQYYDEEEGRCLGVVGGGRVLYVNNTKSCGKNILKPHCSNPRYYYICKKNRTILAQCGHSRHFDNRLQKCVPVSKEEYVSATISPNTDSYEPLEIPNCRIPGSFPVPGECALFYTCESNGHRLHQSFYRCPKDMAYDPTTNMCVFSSTCNDLSPWWCASNVRKENFTLEEAEKSVEVSKQFTLDDENSTICETAFATGEEIADIDTYNVTERIGSYEITTLPSNFDYTATNGDGDKFASTIVSSGEETIPELAESDDKSDIARTPKRASVSSRTTNIVDDTTVSYSGTEKTAFTKKMDLQDNTEVGIRKTPTQEFATTVDSIPVDQHAITEAENIVVDSSTEDVDRRFITEPGITDMPHFFSTFSSRRTDIVTQPSITINTQGTDVESTSVTKVEAIVEDTDKTISTTVEGSNVKVEPTSPIPVTSDGSLVHDINETNINTSAKFGATEQTIEISTDKKIQTTLGGPTTIAETTSSISETSTISVVHDTLKTEPDTSTTPNATVQVSESATKQSIGVTKTEPIVGDPDKEILITVGGPITKIETTSSIPEISTISVIHDTPKIKTDTYTTLNAPEEGLKSTIKQSTGVTGAEPIVGDLNKETQTIDAQSSASIDTTSAIPLTTPNSLVRNTSNMNMDISTNPNTTGQSLEVTTEKSSSITEAETIVNDPNKEILITVGGPINGIEFTSSTPTTFANSLARDTGETVMDTSTKGSTTEQFLEITTEQSIGVTEAEPIVGDLNKGTQTTVAVSTIILETTSTIPSDSLLHETSNMKIDVSTNPSTTEQLLDITTGKETTTYIPVSSTVSSIRDTSEINIDTSTKSGTTEQLLDITTKLSADEVTTKAEPMAGDLNKETQTIVEVSTSKVETTTSNPLVSLVDDNNKKEDTFMKPSTPKQMLYITTRKSVTDAAATVEDSNKKVHATVEGPVSKIETTSSIPTISTVSLGNDTGKIEMDTSTEFSTTEQSLEFTTKQSNGITEAEPVIGDLNKETQIIVRVSTPKTDTTTSLPLVSLVDDNNTKQDTPVKLGTTEKILDITTEKSTGKTEAEEIVEDPNKEIVITIGGPITIIETTSPIPTTSSTSSVHDISKTKIDTSTESSTTEKMLDVTTRKRITDAEAIVEDPSKDFHTIIKEPITNIKTTSSIPTTSTMSPVRDTSKTEMNSSTESGTSEQLLEITTEQSANIAEIEPIVEDLNKDTRTVVRISTPTVEIATSVPMVSPVHDTSSTKIGVSTKPTITEQPTEVITQRGTGITEPEPIVGDLGKETRAVIARSTKTVETTSSTPLASPDSLDDTSERKMNIATKPSLIEQALEVTSIQSISAAEAEEIVEDSDETQINLEESTAIVENVTLIPVTSTAPLLHGMKSSTFKDLLEVIVSRNISATEVESILVDLDTKMPNNIAVSNSRVGPTTFAPVASTDPSLQDASRTKIDTSTKFNMPEQTLEITTAGSVNVTKAETIAKDQNGKGQTAVKRSTTRIETTSSKPVASTNPSAQDTSKANMDASTESSITGQISEGTPPGSITVTKGEDIVEGLGTKVHTTVEGSTIKIETSSTISVASTTTLTQDISETKIDSFSTPAMIEPALEVTAEKSITAEETESIVEDTTNDIQAIIGGSTTGSDRATSAIVSSNINKTNVTECSSSVNANDSESNVARKSTVNCMDNKSTPQSNEVSTISPSIQALLAYCRAYVLAEAAKNRAAMNVSSNINSTQENGLITVVNRTLENSEEVVDYSERTIAKHIAFPIASAVISITDKFERRLKEVLKNMLQ